MKRIAEGPILFFPFYSLFPLIFFLPPSTSRSSSNFFFFLLSLSHPFPLLNISSPFLLLFLFHIYPFLSIDFSSSTFPFFFLLVNNTSICQSSFSLVLSKYSLPLSVRISSKPLLNYLLSALIAFLHVPPPLLHILVRLILSAAPLPSF